MKELLVVLLNFGQILEFANLLLERLVLSDVAVDLVFFFLDLLVEMLDCVLEFKNFVVALLNLQLRLIEALDVILETAVHLV